MSRHSQALAGIFFALGGTFVPSVVSAQVNRAPDPNAARVMVAVFRSSEKGLGVEAADAVRSRVSSDFPFKQVYVLPKKDLEATLEASGFSVVDALEPHDQKALAGILRADEYVTGSVTKTETGVKVSAELVLSRDNTLVQPLGSFEAKNVKDAAKDISHEMKEAFKQIDSEKKCNNLGRQGEFDQAIAAAKEGITAYPKATLARICMAMVMVTQKAPAAQMLQVSREIVDLDPTNQQGLRLLAAAYQDLNQPDSSVRTLTRLLAADPKNPRLQKEVVDALTTLVEPAVARPVIDEAVAANPGDPELLRTRWLILLGQGDFKEAFAQGDELSRIDTSFADTTYFIRTARAYSADSQAQKAAETAARGLQKFPNQPSLVYEQILALQKAGQLQPALDALNKALASNVPVENSGTMRVLLLKDLGQDYLPAIKDAIGAGDTSENLRNLSLLGAQESYKKAAASKEPADFDKAIEDLKYADSIVPSDLKAQAQFLLGATYVSYGFVKVQAAAAAKECEGAKAAKDMFVEAQILLPRGGAFSPDAMRQLMEQVMQLDPYADQVIKAYCK